MKNNWYVVQVTVGREEKIVHQIESNIPQELLIRCFVPKYKFMKRYYGSWHIEEKITFPGYIFIKSDRIEDFFTKLKMTQAFTKMLGLNRGEIFPIYDEDVMFLLKYDENDSLDISKGYILGGKTIITSGPLVGHEGIIRRIDRHKRLAFLEVELLGQITTVKVGLEIISKT